MGNAYNQGLVMIQQAGDTREISNIADGIPRTWCGGLYRPRDGGQKSCTSSTSL